MGLAAAAAGLVACGDDDGGDPDGDDATTTRPTAPAPGGPAPTTTEAVSCADLEDEYLEVFFALGAGTPEDADASRVPVPTDALAAIEARARAAGCSDFDLVVCSAFAELDDAGLTPDVDPPRQCA